MFTGRTGWDGVMVVGDKGGGSICVANAVFASRYLVAPFPFFFN